MVIIKSLRVATTTERLLADFQPDVTAHTRRVRFEHPERIHHDVEYLGILLVRSRRRLHSQLVQLPVLRPERASQRPIPLQRLRSILRRQPVLIPRAVARNPHLHVVVHLPVAVRPSPRAQNLSLSPHPQPRRHQLADVPLQHPRRRVRRRPRSSTLSYALLDGELTATNAFVSTSLGSRKNTSFPLPLTSTHALGRSNPYPSIASAQRANPVGGRANARAGARDRGARQRQRARGVEDASRRRPRRRRRRSSIRDRATTAARRRARRIAGARRRRVDAGVVAMRRERATWRARVERANDDDDRARVRGIAGRRSTHQSSTRRSRDTRARSIARSRDARRCRARGVGRRRARRATRGTRDAATRWRTADDAARALFAWGCGEDGQLGLDDARAPASEHFAASPRRVDARERGDDGAGDGGDDAGRGDDRARRRAGRETRCASTTAGELYAWGWNSHRALSFGWRECDALFVDAPRRSRLEVGEGGRRLEVDGGGERGMARAVRGRGRRGLGVGRERVRASGARGRGGGGAERGDSGSRLGAGAGVDFAGAR